MDELKDILTDIKKKLISLTLYKSPHKCELCLIVDRRLSFTGTSIVSRDPQLSTAVVNIRIHINN